MKYTIVLLILFLIVLTHPAEAASASENTDKAAGAESSEAGASDTESASTKYPSLDSLLVRHQPYLENISAYKPMYFLVGTDPEDSKFQFSFKYRFFNTESDLVNDLPALKGIHFAYTQTSFWDLESDSKPFQDTSYKPELFFLSPNIDTMFSSVKGFFIQTGLEHESNGMAAEESRSTNYLYIHPILILYNEKSRNGLAVGPKIWAYVDNDDETNRDLKDYRGYFDLACKLGQEGGLVISSDFRWARKGGSIQLDATYPLSRFFFNTLDLYLNIQYFNGFAESLTAYDVHKEAFRIGLAVIR